MKHRIFIFIIACLALLLAACDDDAPQPTDGTSVTTEATQESVPPSSTATESPTAPTEGKQIKDMTYDEYISQDRPYTRINTTDWTQEDGNQYWLRKEHEGLTVFSHGQERSVIPGTAHLTGHTLIGCNGEYAFLTSETDILQVTLETGEIRPVATTHERVLGAWLCDDVMLYYALYDADHNEIRIFVRIYLEERNQLIIIPDVSLNGTPLSWFYLEWPESNKSYIRWYTMSEQMLAAIKKELADPDSIYQYEWLKPLQDDPERIYDPQYHELVKTLAQAIEHQSNILALTCFSTTPDYGIFSQVNVSVEKGFTRPPYRQLEVILYQPEYADLYPGYDFTDCTSGHYYAGNRITKELTWLHDGTISQLHEQEGTLFHSATSKGSYIYYTLKDEPTNIYRMDYEGVVRDELVYEGDPTLPMDFMVISKTHDYEQLAIHQGKNIYILDLLEDTCELVYEDDNIYALWSYYYDPYTKSFTVAYEGDHDGYRWHYNITTGEMDQYPNL